MIKCYFYPGLDGASAAVPDQCAGIEFDAIARNEKGATFFFKGREQLFCNFTLYSPCFSFVLNISL